MPSYRSPRKCPVDLNSLIREMCLKLAPTLQENRINLSEHLDPGLPQVQFDPLLLRQVLLNIAKNAIEAMPAGGALTFTSGRDHDRVSVRIADSGEGIAPDIIDKIFQPFFSTKPKGSGLGLAISQTIVKAHQGEISRGQPASPGHRRHRLLASEIIAGPISPGIFPAAGPIQAGRTPAWPSRPA